MEEHSTLPALPSPDTHGSGSAAQSAEQTIKPKGGSNKAAVAAGIVGALIVIGIIVGVVLLIMSDNATTGRVRDVFIILMALESIVIGAALVILIVQLATLINLLQNEIKPIVQSTNETVNTLRGTVMFLSDNLTEPVIKLNSAMAGLKQFMDLMHIGKR